MKRTLATMFAFAILSIPTIVRASDLEDLKATFEKAVEALNSRNLDGFIATIHPQALSFYSCGPTSGKEGRDVCEQDWQKFFSYSGPAAFKSDTFEYRVIGNTGIVWGKYGLSVKGKDGKEKSYSGRFSLIYAKTDGKWMVVWQENSPTPAGSTNPSDD